MTKKMGLWEAVSIAVGTMIGASIFSVFGLGARIAGHNLPFVFILSGILALLVAYSYAKLGSEIVSNAGPMEFILRGFGDSILTGSLSILTWFTYVVSIALFAKGFAGYFLPAVGLANNALNMGLTALGVVLVFTAVGLLGSKVVGRAEFFIVLVKVAVLGVFIVLGVWTIHPAWITPAFTGRAAASTLNSTAVFFLSYMGFGLITNASENITNPERNVPRAIFLSILIVTIIYVFVSAVAVGNLPLPDLIRAQDNALAEAAKPFLGRFGYILISVGALFSISSALNATLFGGANIAYALAKDGELPEAFERKLWFGGSEGLYLTAGLGLLMALLFDLGAIASMTSAVFMVIYLFVLLSHYRLTGKVGGNRPFIIFSFCAVWAVFAVLLHYQWQTNHSAFYGTCLTFLCAFLVEVVYRVVTKRELISREVRRIEGFVEHLFTGEQNR